MSYILDALKKADSERQHGAVPNIHAQPLTKNALGDEDPFWKNPLLWIFLTALVFMCGVFLLFFNGQSAPAAAPSVVTSAPTPSVPLSPSAASNVPAVAAASPTAPNQASGNPVAVDALPAEPVKLKPSRKLPTPVTKEKRAPVTSVAAAPAAEQSGLKLAAALPDETIQTTLRDLPQKIQSEIPTLTVGGYIYSDNRAECQLLINKLLLHEGDQIAPGLMLEKMMQHSAILSYKGYRYRISY